MKSSPTRRQIRFARISLTGLILGWSLILVNCESLQSLLPRQSWSRRWGPMVPHRQFPGDCSICHVSDRWDVIREDFEFDHEKETGFALEGAHAWAACLRCHNDRGPVQLYTARGCGGCHVDPHQSALGLECAECHNQTHWEPLGLVADHARFRFPLVGAHAITPCETCHERASSGFYSGAPVQCHLCHQRDAAGAFPNHVINNWITDCERCHAPLNWKSFNFNHDFFPLVGGHGNLACIQCHANGLFIAVPRDCFFCHQNDYLGAPNHVANNFSTDCTLCHNIFGWR